MNKWTLLYTFNNSGLSEHSISLPVCDELLIEMSFVVNTVNRHFTIVIPFEMLSNVKEAYYLGGGYSSTSYNSYTSVSMSKTTIAISGASLNGGEYNSTATLRLYAR